MSMFRFDNSYARDLEGLYAPWQGEAVPDPAFVKVNRELALELGVDPDALNTAEGAAMLTGTDLPEGATPIAQAYAGHQFGGFSPQLGDGRALLIGEIVDAEGRRRDLQLKGSGRTPFSRGGDGKAALGPVLREYLIGEFMHAVGVPTTRSLAALTTGEIVMREAPLHGAILARVASSHIRVGTFQFFAARRDVEKLRRLADYTIARHFPELRGVEDPYGDLLRGAVQRQAALIAKWMGIGFVHGVMNTDNTTISGETIDYGPCAFIDAYDPAAVYSSIDHGGRYAFGNQAAIGQWNLARFAETLLPLFDGDGADAAVEVATEIVEGFQPAYVQCWLQEMRTKLGLRGDDEGDRSLIEDLLATMGEHGVDFTGLFRGLADTLRGADGPLRELLGGADVLDAWIERWRERLGHEAVSPEDQAAAMDRVNPIYVPRNHKVEEALQAADTGDLGPFEVLLELLTSPYVRVDGREEFTRPAPSDFGPYTTYCGT